MFSPLFGKELFTVLTVLKTTHEKIANHMGTAREVVTRMLKYFQNEGMVKLTRGTIEILDEERLTELQD